MLAVVEDVALVKDSDTTAFPLERDVRDGPGVRSVVAVRFQDGRSVPVRVAAVVGEELGLLKGSSADGESFKEADEFRDTAGDREGVVRGFVDANAVSLTKEAVPVIGMGVPKEEEESERLRKPDSEVETLDPKLVDREIPSSGQVEVRKRDGA